MKKFLIAATAAMVAISAYAEGYQINTLSAKQNGMGHTGTALKLGAESMFFNPAGLGFSEKTLDLVGSISGIKANAKATIDDEIYKTDNGISTPISVHAAFKIYNNLQCGISFYTPYGSSINWGENWPGAVLNQKVDLKTYTIQPTFAWRITPKLSVGAGLMISWGAVDLNKALISAESLNTMIAPMSVGSTTPASINLTGTADVAVGINLGVMYDINDKWTVGLNWRSKQTMEVTRGKASVAYNIENPAIKQKIESMVKYINNAEFAAAMPMPQVFKLGVSYKPIKNLTLAFDAQYTNWKTYKKLCINFLDDNLKEYNQYIDKKYSDAWCFNLGAQYNLTNRFDIRAGLMIDTTPVNDNYYNPETPGMTKIEPSVGFSFRPINRLSIDFSFMYVAGLGIDNASVTYEDMALKKNVTLTADYKVHAFVPAIGIGYSF